MGFVRKQPSRNRGTRYQSLAVLDGPGCTFDTFALATDACSTHAETAARHGDRGGDPRAGRRPFADVAEEYWPPSSPPPLTSHVRATPLAIASP